MRKQLQDIAEIADELKQAVKKLDKKIVSKNIRCPLCWLLSKINGHLDDHSKRITVTETLQKERNKTSKKTIGAWLSGAIAIAVALWKAFTGNP